MSEEFRERDLAGARFEQVDLAGAAFKQVRLRGARIADADLSGLRIRGCHVADVQFSGEVGSLFVQGIDVVPLVEAELDRRHPERTRLRPTDADGFRAAWPVVEQLWAGTVERARRLDPALLHEQVAGEWSFVETLRHLAFATDCWVRRALLGDPYPWDPLDLPWDEAPDLPGVPRDRAVQPSLDEVLALRAGRMETVRQVLVDLTDDRLAGVTVPVPEPGWPESQSFPVREVLLTVLDEEWWHHHYALRDLDVLTGQAAPA